MSCYVYDKVRLLWELNRKEEASVEWLTFRGYNRVQNDVVHLEQKLSDLQTQLHEYEKYMMNNEKFSPHLFVTLKENVCVCFCVWVCVLTIAID